MFGEVPLDRVVAVVARLPGDRTRWGSGFLMTPEVVLTAWHCTVADPVSGTPVALEVRRRVAAGWESARVLSVTASRSAEPSPGGGWGLDVALLVLAEPPWADAGWFAPPFARVRRGEAGELVDCVAVGYPMYELDPGGELSTAEVRGFIRQGEGQGSHSEYLVLRDDKLGAVQAHPEVIPGDQIDRSSPWGGISGALVFHRGRVLGHVVQHRPHLGNNPLSVVPIDQLGGSTKVRARQIAEALGLPPPKELAWATGAVSELAGLVDQLGPGGDLPTVGDLTPYQLGADPTRYGNRDSHGLHDPYVRRTAAQVDQRLAEILMSPPQSLVLLVGPSKAGKTRTAFQALMTTWPGARLAKPDPTHVAQVLDHPRISGSNWPLVIWLDDVQRFLVGDHPLTPARLAALLKRPGPTVVIATLRQEERARLSEGAELVAGARQLLDDAETNTVYLKPTSADPDEQDAARFLYPDLDLDEYGLAEQLAGAPALLRQYTDADPLLRAILETAIDWERVGVPDAIAQDDLSDLAKRRLPLIAKFLDPTEEDMQLTITKARTPPLDFEGRSTGQLAALLVHRTESGGWSYRAYPYLVAHEDGQDGPPRALPGAFWHQVLDRVSPEAADAIGEAAYSRGNIDAAVAALTIAVETRHPKTMYNLAFLLAERVDPPELDAARGWYERAAEAGYFDAMRSLGILLATMVDPPELDAAREWYERAAEAGHINAMTSLGNLLSDRVEPPELDAARGWYERAAEAGDTDAMINLGILLATMVDPPELDAAREWYERAAEAGDTDAMHNLGLLLATMVDPPELDAARGWYERAAEAGHTDAMRNLGILLATMVDPPELDAARGWYERAAEAGDTDAMLNLGILLATRVDPPELDAARGWYERAAEAGDTDAMLNLGILLATQVDPPELDAARGWYERAAEAGDTDAMLNLGILSESQVDPPELEAARGWYERAAEAGTPTR